MISNETLKKNARHAKLLLSPWYFRTRRMLNSLSFGTKEEWRAWQLERLQEVLIHAFDNVPYYRESFRAAGLNPRQLRSIEEFRQYPVLTKSQYSSNIDGFRAENRKASRVHTEYTGGTTGQPVGFFRERRDNARELAYAQYTYRMLGLAPFPRTLYMRGPVEDARQRFHRYEQLGCALRLSTSNMSDFNLEFYVRLIRRYKPRLIYAVPSSLTILCDYLERRSLPPFQSVRWIYAQSENLYPFQERLIERVLGCPVYTSYGQKEHVVSAWRCLHSNHYHVLPQYGYAELLDERCNPVEQEGEIGRVVGTGFANFCAPLIRYDTGDYAIPASRRCPCGTIYESWERLEGRGPSIAFTKNGGHACLGPMLLCHLHRETVGRIRQFGIEQYREGELVVRVVPVDNADPSAIGGLFEHAIHNEYPGLFDIRMVIGDKPALSETGKHLFFRQHIRRDSITPVLGAS
jgi:phenylacetate-CoA ligase